MKRLMPQKPKMPQQSSRKTKQLLESAQTFEAWYETLQKHFPCVVSEPSHETEKLVDSNENFNLPIYRWYNLKESFSAKLPLWVVTQLKERYQHITRTALDPFMGSGTTGVALAASKIRVTGVEYNSFIRSVAMAKASASNVEPESFEKILGRLENFDWKKSAVDIPELSTLHEREYVSKRNLGILLATVERIETLRITPEVRLLLRVGVASAVEQAFNLRKDGRALRYIPDRANRDIFSVITENWRQILADVKTFQQTKKKTDKCLFTVYSGSATDLKNLRNGDDNVSRLIDNSFDTAIYSPPYLNNFDYSEVYKLEIWLLGFIGNYEEWKNLRLGTLRSHPSIIFPETNYLSNDKNTRHIAKRIEEMTTSICLSDKTRSATGRTIRGYFDDMYLALKEQWRVLNSGGIASYIVANSRHYYLPIATDLILAEIARCIGFEPLELVVLRKRNGRTRQKSFLRETVVFIKKP